MNLPFQTVVLVFGVTLAHLLAIALLAPVDGGGEFAEARRSAPDITLPGLLDDALSDFPDDEAEFEPDAETRALPLVAEESEVLDPPARRREEAVPEAPASEPVAEAQAVPDGDLLPRPFSPVPRS
jgi:hypothetical protein